MGIHVREKRGKLYLDIYKDGLRRWEATGLSVSTDSVSAKEARKLAEIIRAKREMQLVSEAWDISDPIAGKQSLVGYAEQLAARKDKNNSLPKSLRYLREYAGTVQLSAINERWLEGYKSFLLDQKGLGKSTARNYLGACTFVLHQAEINRKIVRNPSVAVKKIRPNEVKKVYLVAEEIAALAAAPLQSKVGYELCRGFLFACCTGLRVSDIRSLKWEDIERTPKPAVLKKQQKTEDIVGIPLNMSAWAIINDGTIHKKDEYVFPRLAEKKSSSSDKFKAWCKQAKIEKVIGWHTARHTFATLSLESGADLSTVSRLLGHRDVSTTSIYAKTTDRAKRVAVDALPSIEIGARKYYLKDYL